LNKSIAIKLTHLIKNILIPNFDHNNVIPPHLGNPIHKEHLSPYRCTTLELCKRFATSKERIEILNGLLLFRKKMNNFGIKEGFQWLDGSFIENIEVSEKRAPRDLDLVTFFGGLTFEYQKELAVQFTEFLNPTFSKEKYKLDHYIVDYCFSPDATVELTRYWVQLFSHNRLNIWKGMLRLELNTPEIDTESIQYLKEIIL
jgi:hypothetical protein